LRPNAFGLSGLNDEVAKGRNIEMKIHKFAAGAVFIGAVAAEMFGKTPTVGRPRINVGNRSGWRR
jgi:hypothetical protein